MSFVQNDGENISEGIIYVGKNRIRINYDSPTEILLILSNDKAMYYNYELDENEFFNPKNTSAWFFFEIFSNLNFFFDSNMFEDNRSIIIEKIGNYDLDEYNLKLYFEDSPLILRKIELKHNDVYLALSLFNYKHNEEFDKNFFKLINPNFFN